MSPFNRVFPMAVAVSLATLAALAGPASAQDASCAVHEDTESRQTEARARFGQGDELVEAQRFTEAVAAYECSFQNVPHPSTLHNIARAAELSGQFRRALDAWRGYLEMSPDATDVAEVRARISALDSSLNSGEQPGPAQTGGTGTAQPNQQLGTQPPPAAAAAPQQWQTPEGVQTNVYTPGQTGQTYQVVERRQPSPIRPWAWSIMGGGIAAAAVGVYLLVPSIRLDTCGPNGEDPDGLCTGAGWVLLGAGAAAMVSAVLIWIFAEPGGEYVVTRQAALTPTLAVDNDGRINGLAAAWTMRF